MSSTLSDNRTTYDIQIQKQKMYAFQLGCMAIQDHDET